MTCNEILINLNSGSADVMSSFFQSINQLTDQCTLLHYNKFYQQHLFKNSEFYSAVTPSKVWIL